MNSIAPGEWKRLFATALSHGTQLETKRLLRPRLDSFLACCGIGDVTLSHSGVSSVFVDTQWLLHRKQASSDAFYVDFDGFRAILAAVVERIAAHLGDATPSGHLAAVERFIFPHLEKSIVQPEMRLSLDARENEWGAMTHSVIAVLVDESFEGFIRPLFHYFARSTPDAPLGADEPEQACPASTSDSPNSEPFHERGFMSFAQFRRFVRVLGLSDVIDDELAYNIFGEANAQDTKGLLSGVLGPELELDEFIDVLLMSAVAFFADEEERYPMHITVQSKVFSFWKLIFERCAENDELTIVLSAAEMPPNGAAHALPKKRHGNRRFLADFKKCDEYEVKVAADGSVRYHQVGVYAALCWPRAVNVDRLTSFIVAGVNFFNADSTPGGLNAAPENLAALEAIHALIQRDEEDERIAAKKRSAASAAAAKLTDPTESKLRSAITARRPRRPTAAQQMNMAQPVPPLLSPVTAALQDEASRFETLMSTATDETKTSILNAGLSALGVQARRSDLVGRERSGDAKPVALQIAESVFFNHSGSVEMGDDERPSAPRIVFVTLNGVLCDTHSVRRNRIKVSLPANSLRVDSLTLVLGLVATTPHVNRGVELSDARGAAAAGALYHVQAWSYELVARRVSLGRVHATRAVLTERCVSGVDVDSPSVIAAIDRLLRQRLRAGRSIAAFATTMPAVFGTPVLLEVQPRSFALNDAVGHWVLVKAANLFQQFATPLAIIPFRDTNCKLFLLRDGFLKMAAEHPKMLPRRVQHPFKAGPQRPSTAEQLDLGDLFDVFALRPPNTGGARSRNGEHVSVASTVAGTVHPLAQVIENGWDFVTSIDVDPESGVPRVAHRPIPPPAHEQASGPRQHHELGASHAATSVMSFTGFLLLLVHSGYGARTRSTPDFSVPDLVKLLAAVLDAEPRNDALQQALREQPAGVVDKVYSSRVQVPFEQAQLHRAYFKNQSPRRECRWDDGALDMDAREVSPTPPDESTSAQLPRLPSASLAMGTREKFVAEVRSSLTASAKTPTRPTVKDPARASARRRLSFTEVLLSPSVASRGEESELQEDVITNEEAMEPEAAAPPVTSAYAPRAPASKAVLLGGASMVPSHVALVAREACAEHLHSLMQRTSMAPSAFR